MRVFAALIAFSWSWWPWSKPTPASAPASPPSLQESRWKAAKVRPERVKQVESIAARILRSRGRYEAVAKDAGVPWFVIAGLHNMEASGSFSKHLHEGSPLTGRTRWVPKGRPLTGTPPFTWEFSAVDALRYDRMDSVNWQSLDAALYACERYNGTGYLKYHPEVPTPYLWSHTTIYTRGKYIADGKWSSTAISAQTGIAAIWKRLESQKAITLPK
jgi:lysozyme family protein